jgi:hypothetical protein
MVFPVVPAVPLVPLVLVVLLVLAAPSVLLDQLAPEVLPVLLRHEPHSLARLQGY